MKILKLIQEILKEEILKGGLADNKTLEDISKKHKVSLSSIESQAKKGLKVEKEHTSNHKEAMEIVKDHLTEDPKYYDKLSTIEK